MLKLLTMRIGMINFKNRYSFSFLIILISNLNSASAEVNLICGLGAEPPSNTQPGIVNGFATSGYPNVASVHSSSNGNNGICTATLIGENTAITAAHCVYGSYPNQCVNKSKDSYSISLPHYGIYKVKSAVPHPHYDCNTLANDLAILKLVTPVLGSKPSEYPLKQLVRPGHRLSIVGYGRTGGNDYSFGIKRAGRVIAKKCNVPVTNVPHNATHVCWDFTTSDNHPAGSSNTCSGDSGGPAYFGSQLVGVTSAGVKEDCLAGDRSFNIRISKYSSWIKKTIGNATRKSDASSPETSFSYCRYPKVKALVSPIAKITKSGNLNIFVNGYGAELRGYDLVVNGKGSNIDLCTEKSLGNNVSNCRLNSDTNDLSITIKPLFNNNLATNSADIQLSIRYEYK